MTAADALDSHLKDSIAEIGATPSPLALRKGAEMSERVKAKIRDAKTAASECWNELESAADAILAKRAEIKGQIATTAQVHMAEMEESARSMRELEDALGTLGNEQPKSGEGSGKS